MKSAKSLFLKSLLVLGTIGLALTLTRPARAAGSQPTTITITAPPSARLGGQLSLQAKLTSGSDPVADAVIDFSIPTTFLHTTDWIVVAEAKTNAQGVAQATYEPRITGSTSLKASFAGDATHAASESSAPIVISGAGQLYVQEAGVKLQGFNQAPRTTANWPRWALSGWPIPAVLITVWSLYATAVFFLSRIPAAAASERAAAGEKAANPRRWLAPVLFGGVVVTLSSFLLLIGARSPYTHENLTPSFDYDYTRTQETQVGSPVKFAGMSMPMNMNEDLVTRGYHLFVGLECASCHGLKGEGGAFAPTIAGIDLNTVAQMTSTGPGGMPVYEQILPDELEAIVAYLDSVVKHSSAPAQDGGATP